MVRCPSTQINITGHVFFLPPTPSFQLTNMTSHDTTKWIACSVSTCIVLFIYLPLLLLWYRRLKRFSNLVIIQKRYPSIVSIMMALGAFYMIGRPLSSVSITMLATRDCIIPSCDIAYFIYYAPVTFFHSIPIIATPIYLFIKYWLIYYGMLHYIFISSIHSCCNQS